MNHKQKLHASANKVRRDAVRRKTSTLAISRKTSNKPPVSRRGVPQNRCKTTRSAGYDSTGERAIECGAPAELMCALCGPMCAECAENTFCFRGEHRLLAIQNEPADNCRSRTAKSKRLQNVVVLQMSCRKCGTLRLLWPTNPRHHPAMNRKCPGCKRRVQAIVLGQGWTRIRLPYFEQVDELLDICASRKLERRIPWDILKTKRDCEE